MGTDPKKALGLAALARQGHFVTTLPDLMDLASSGRPSAWQGAATAIDILLWLDRFDDAGALASATIERHGAKARGLSDYDTPFDVALLAAERYANRPAKPRLRELAGVPPVGSVLRNRLDWLSAELDKRPIEELLPNFGAWGRPAVPADHVIGLEFADLGYSSLKTNEKRALWQALRTANRFDQARDLHSACAELPAQYGVLTWMAGWYATIGEPEIGAGLLISAHDTWWPNRNWDALPADIVTQPTLRQLATDRVRYHYLNDPIGQ